MPGVYGDMLASFPELMRRFDIFHMAALPGGGFTDRAVRLTQIRAYITRDTGGAAGIPDDTFVEGQQAKFFCFDRIPNSMIRQGMYVEDSGEMFKFIQDNNFAREGGFAVYKLEIVTGVTDLQVRNEQVEVNINNAY